MKLQRLTTWFVAVLLALGTSAACSTSGGAEASSADHETEHSHSSEASAETEGNGESNKHDHGDHGEKSEKSGSRARGDAEGDSSGGHHGGDAHSDHQEKKFENPEKLADDWNSPERDEWQRPEAVVEAMGIEAGMSVADVGTGTGYFVPHLADAVGESGRVVAVDIEQSMLDYVEKVADEHDLDNVETVLAEKTDTNLEKGAVDRILIVNTWHHIPNRGNYAEHLRERLTDGGSVWIVDFQRDSPSGPPKKHRLEPNEIVEELEAGGFDAEVHDLELDRQYLVVGRTN